MDHNVCVWVSVCLRLRVCLLAHLQPRDTSYTWKLPEQQQEEKTCLQARIRAPQHKHKTLCLLQTAGGEMCFHLWRLRINACGCLWFLNKSLTPSTSWTFYISLITAIITTVNSLIKRNKNIFPLGKISIPHQNYSTTLIDDLIFTVLNIL